MASPVISTLVQRFDQKAGKHTACTDQEKAVLSRQIEDSDSQIDKLV
jgi:hypothetical protein